MTPHRVLVTGSRDWTDAGVVHDALDALLTEHGSLVVVYGACPTGADAQALAWAMDRWTWENADVHHEPHPADWSGHGKAAGPIRNAEMVAAGADSCLAFIRAGSRGATDCAERAEAAGIPTRIWRAP